MALLLALAVVGCSSTQNNGVNNMALSITSPAFFHQGKIPSKYTCDGENISPPLQINGVPAGTKSLVLIMDDPDIPVFVKEKFNIQVWDHWVVWNIPPNTKDIPEKTGPEGTKGKNTGGSIGYGGPCPPDREQRYFFKLYALDTKLDLAAGAAKKEIEEVMEGHIIEKTELIGLYKRI